MLKAAKKAKKIAKNQQFEISNSVYNFGRDPP